MSKLVMPYYGAVYGTMLDHKYNGHKKETNRNEKKPEKKVKNFFACSCDDIMVDISSSES